MSTTASASDHGGPERDEILEGLETRGYAILRDAVEPELVVALRERVLELERELAVPAGDNEFTGRATVRVWSLPGHGQVFERAALHPAVLPRVERILGQDCLLSSMSAITIGPGETPQPLHADDQLTHLRKPHAPLFCNAMWALSDFTEENGATRLVPGSHRADHSPRHDEEVETIAAEMPAGSILFIDGSLWHGGGPNRSGERRIGLSSTYCAGFVRPDENLLLALPRDAVRRFPRRLQELVGYGQYRQYIGHVAMGSPRALLEGD